MHIADLVDWRARKFGPKVALKGGPHSRTFAEVNDRADRLVAALQGLGLAKGDRVAVLAETGVDYAELTLTVPCGGMILIAVNSRFVAEEIAYTIEDCGAVALFVGPEYLSVLDEIRPKLTTVRHVIHLGVAPADGLSYEGLLASQGSPPSRVPIVDTDPAYIVYTSGTTSKPKGVIRSHKSLIATATATLVHHGTRASDVCYLPNPPFHISFVWPLVTFYSAGATTVIERWNTEDALRTIERERVSFGVFVPFFVRSLLNAPGFAEHDLSSLRRLSMGSAPMDESLARQAVATFGNIFNYNYGMTEYGSPIAMIHGDAIDLGTEAGRALLSSVGRAVFNADVRVVDENGRDVKAGGAGEVLVRGDALMSGYWNMPEETARAMQDGYFRTGDVARVDADGNLFIVDRAKDMIITGGENVFCPEVESAIMKHPAVREAAVIGIPDDRWGEAVRGVVMLRDGAEPPTSEELREFCRPHLAGYKIPKAFDFVEDFPRTSVGKIAKRTLRAPHWAGRTRNVH